MKERTTLKRILIVDDEPNVANILMESLQSLGDDYRVETAHNGREAIAQIKDTQYDLVISDYKMPGMSGLELAQTIRQQSPDTLLMLMTGYGTATLQDIVGSLKLDGYIDKPITTTRIRKIVRQAVERTAQEKDPYRAGRRAVIPSTAEYLKNLWVNTNARCVLLLSSSGYAVETAGQVNTLDIAGIGALVAANFMAAAELARLLGNQSVFRSSHYEGPHYDIYVHSINYDLFLAVIFGSESKMGLVRFYTHETVTALDPLMDGAAAAPQPTDSTWAPAVQEELDRLFESH